MDTLTISRTLSAHAQAVQSIAPAPPPIIATKPAAPLSNRKSFLVSTLLVTSNFIQITSFSCVFGSTFAISRALGIASLAQSVWIVSSYPLTQGAIVTVSGRMGSRFGHKNTLVAGGIIWTLFTFANALCKSPIAFAVCRALTGIGGGLLVPNAVAIIGINFPPGKARNLSLGFFGAGAPVGGWLGYVIAGIFTRFTPWKWMFVFLGFLGVVQFSLVWWAVPKEEYVYLDQEKERMDWLGAALGFVALMMFSFVWIQAPLVTWSQPYIPAMLGVSILFFTVLAYHSHRTPNPFFPMHIWASSTFSAVILVSLFSFMSFGIGLWYLTAWLQLIRHFTVLKYSLAFLPGLVCGISTALLSSYLIRRVSPQWLLAFGSMGTLAASILLAIMPIQQNYWFSSFWSVVLMCLCPDLIFTAAQIIACNSVQRHEQGLAGSLVAALQLYGTSIGLGFAGTVEVYVGSGSSSLQIGGSDIQGTVKGYRAALWFGAALAAIAILIDLVFVRMDKDESEGWADEKKACLEINEESCSV